MSRLQACVRFHVITVFLFVIPASATELATLTGYVTDPSGLRVTHCRMQATNLETNISYAGETNDVGLYRISEIPTGQYRVIVQKTGFKTIVKQAVELHVQDVIALNFQLELGSVAESVTVEGGAPLINTESAVVSTVVDRQFAENLPLNGRSFQTLIDLTPGVVITPSTAADSGQFSVNGQRASSNYWTVDGVSANFGMGAGASQGDASAGALPGFSAQGSTNNLVSEDALQEFRIQTSTYAPEFGRTPGAQISVITRSGTNNFHGTAFDYLRNDALDANDWFANHNGLPKPKERQNDFGGTLGGPIVRDRTFFFFSYEGMRLRLPAVLQSTVPSVSVRQAAVPSMQPFLNAYPLPNGPDIGNGIARFNASTSNNSSLDAISVRIDDRLSDSLLLFGRYNYSPSQIDQRQPSISFSPSMVESALIRTHTGTAGLTWRISGTAVNDARINFSRNEASDRKFLDTFGGAVAVPASASPLPSGFSTASSFYEVGITALSGGFYFEGAQAQNLQRQFNVVDTFSTQLSSHSLKFGVDYRRLTPQFAPPVYGQFGGFSSVANAEVGNLATGNVSAKRGVSLALQNLGVFAQDSWHLSGRITLTYGLRWDVDYSPSTVSGPSIAAVTNFQDLASLALAPASTPVFSTHFGNVAPRVGLAYELRDRGALRTVVRAGFGVFYDLATAELGNLLNTSSYPLGATQTIRGGTYPFSSGVAAPPTISPAQLATGGLLNAFDPNLQLPYTLQWNVALEQSLAARQSVSATYIGALGRRLMATEFDAKPNANFSQANLVSNQGTSDYHGLQLQYQNRLTHGLQALASYSLAHSIDTGSASSAFGNQANIFSRRLSVDANRGPSDFDVRHSASAGVMYQIPARRLNSFVNSLLEAWSVDNMFQARSAPPLNVNDPFVQLVGDKFVPVRPDLVPGVQIWIPDSTVAGNKRLNPGAFVDPPLDPVTHVPVREGNLSRNAIRGFGAWQWDFAVHRNFPIHESIALQFRAEVFNLLNHPNFGPPLSFLKLPNFGQSTQMLGRSFDQAPGVGSFSSLYQLGGPRSAQFALKLLF